MQEDFSTHNMKVLVDRRLVACTKALTNYMADLKGDAFVVIQNSYTVQYMAATQRVYRLCKGVLVAGGEATAVLHMLHQQKEWATQQVCHQNGTAIHNEMNRLLLTTIVEAIEDLGKERNWKISE